MKIFFSLPTNEEFYTRYATLIPTLDKLGYLAQIVSALTEFGIIYTLIYNSFADFWPEYATKAATAGAIVGTAFLEIGLRKFTPYSARAILYRRFSGLDAWMSGFVIVACLGLLSASGSLSFFGSKQIVEAVAPEPEQQTTTAADSTANEAEAEARAAWVADSTALATNYADQIAAVDLATAATVRQHRAGIATLRRRERAEQTSYATRRAELAEKIEAARAEGAAAIARLKSQQSDQLSEARATYRQALGAAKSTHATDVGEIRAANEAEAAAIDQQVSNYGGSLAYFTILCLGVFVLSVSLKEIHLAGAGVAEEIEPDAYTFEAGPMAAFWAAITGRINRRVYGIIHAIEKRTREAPEPVAPPTLWKRSREGIPHRISETGIERRAADDRRRIGFNIFPLHPQRYTGDNINHPDAANDPLNDMLDNAFHDSNEAIGEAVTNDNRYNGDQSANGERVVYVDKNTVPCANCGERFLPKNKRHRFCSNDCRMDHHASKHGGCRFDPTRKR